MHSTPKELKSYDIAYEIRRKIKDEENWMLGRYVLSAVAVAVEHNLAGKKAKSEYIKEPFLSKLEEMKGLTKEEIDKMEIDKMIMAERQWAQLARSRGMKETILK